MSRISSNLQSLTSISGTLPGGRGGKKKEGKGGGEKGGKGEGGGEEAVQ